MDNTKRAAHDSEIANINVEYGIKDIWELSAVMRTLANATLQDPRDLASGFKTLAELLHQQADELAMHWHDLEKARAAELKAKGAT